MAKNKADETTEPAAPVPGIRTALAALSPSAAHSAAAAALGHDVSHVIAQIDASLTDAVNGLRQLESTAGGVGADKIAALIERLS